ncbi:hypothetical protein PR048_000078 [Dryococelus australis]|uniref:Reverse transcriptase domain-containing protein n=1 Tax=Dryococelus australis TaxID=614101 RepID=A0ABQ9IEK8_9NEOP|nr:hypothetical protein PR048_000078 [Dryococelus australis]
MIATQLQHTFRKPRLPRALSPIPEETSDEEQEEEDFTLPPLDPTPDTEDKMKYQMPYSSTYRQKPSRTSLQCLMPLSPPATSQNSGKMQSYIKTVAETDPKTAQEQNLLPNVQFGFRKGHSITHAVCRITRTVFTAFKRKQRAGALLLDLARILLQSYLTNRTFHVGIQNHLSSPKTAEAGVPQGFILSPILFLLFICHIPIPKDISITQCADDTIILASAQDRNTLTKRLTDAFHRLNNYFTNLGIFTLNVHKTTALYLSRLPKDHPPPLLKLGNEQINWTDKTKYLGVILDRKLFFNQHLKETAGHIRGAIRGISSRRQITLHTSITIFKAFIMLLLTYAVPVWVTTATNTHRPMYTSYEGIRVIT